MNSLPYNLETHYPVQLVHLDLHQPPRGVIWSAIDDYSHEATVQVIRMISVPGPRLSFINFLAGIGREFSYPIHTAVLHQCFLINDAAMKLDGVVLLLARQQCPDHIEKALGALMGRVQKRIAEGWFTRRISLGGNLALQSRTDTDTTRRAAHPPRSGKCFSSKLPCVANPQLTYEHCSIITAH